MDMLVRLELNPGIVLFQQLGQLFVAQVRSAVLYASRNRTGTVMMRFLLETLGFVGVSDAVPLRDKG